MSGTPAPPASDGPERPHGTEPVDAAEPLGTDGAIDANGTTDPAVGDDAAVAPAEVTFTPFRPTLGGFAAWLALASIGAALDGWVGLLPAFLVALLAFARADRRVLGGLGVGLLCAVPAVVLAEARTGIAQVDQDYAYRSMLPQHLTFVGLALTVTWALIDLKPLVGRLRGRRAVPDAAEPFDGWPAASRFVVVGVVAVAAILAVAAIVAR